MLRQWGLFIVAVSVGAGALAQEPAPHVVRFGFAAPLSGAQAHYGLDMHRGLILALDQANAANITLDGEPVRFELIVRDDKADPGLARQIAKQFTNEPISGILGHLNSDTSIQAAEIYHLAGLPQMAMASALAYTEQAYDTTFRMMGNDAQQGDAIAQFVVKDLGARRVACLHDGSAYGQGLSERVHAGVEQAQAQVVLSEVLPHWDGHQFADIQSWLQRIKDSRADVVFFGGTDLQAAALRNALSDAQMNVAFITGEMGRTRAFLRRAGHSAEGVYASLSGVPLPGLAAGRRFMQEYDARFDQQPAIYAAYAYDGAWSLIQAMQQADSAQAERYLPALRRLKRSGVTSQNISYDSRGNLRESAFTVYQVRNGQWRMVKTLVSQSRTEKRD